MMLFSCTILLPAGAQTPIKFTLDWVFQGPTSPFLVALEKGYYKAEGLDVTMDPGQGSAGAVQRVATGAYHGALQVAGLIVQRQHHVNAHFGPFAQ